MLFFGCDLYVYNTHPELVIIYKLSAIVSPYAYVDWETYEQYKAALHTYTTNSDGRNTLSEVIEEHYIQDYDILAITDHDTITADWVSTPNGITQERYDEISAGHDRYGSGALPLPSLSVLFLRKWNRVVHTKEKKDEIFRQQQNQ